MVDILFGQSYYLRFDPKLYAAMQPYPPLGTMIAAAWLREHGYTVALFDAMLAESEMEWEAALERHQPRFTVIYEDNFNYLSKMCLLNMREAALRMIGMARARGCTVILAGSDVSDHPDVYLRAGADYAVIGEGEETVRELVARLAAGETTVADIPGLAYRSDGGEKRTPPRPPMRSVDLLPFPAWDLIDVTRYRRIWQEHHGYFSMNIVTTRGCPFHCNWCAKPIWGQRYAARSPQSVVAEMVWLQENFQPDHLWFADDIMGLKPGWWQEFADLLVGAGVRIPFKCLSRADLIVREPQNVIALARAGCEIVWMGAESGSQKILNLMEKGTTIPQIEQAAADLRAAGVGVGFFLQFGYPGETRADIDATLDLVRRCAPDDIGMSVSYPLPGTKFYQHVQSQLQQRQHWHDSADLAMLYAGPFSTSFYRQLHRVLHKEFRTRKAWRRWRQIWRRPSAWRRADLRELAASTYRLVTLPPARRRLARLAAAGKQSIPPAPAMSLTAASRPSPQGGDRE